LRIESLINLTGFNKFGQFNNTKNKKYNNNKIN
jgi:hypothetical protein